MATTRARTARTSVLAAAAALIAAFGPAPATAAVWRPDVDAARAFALQRRGVVSFAVRTPDRRYGFRADHAAPSASVLKAMLLVAYLRRRSVRFRPLRAADRRLLAPMVRRSDNATASRVCDLVGDHGLRRVARHASMQRFQPHRPWGASVITADDQARFFLRIDRLIPPRHRAYAMTLLRTVVRSQRWGIARATPRGWRLYFKGGWGRGTGAVDHQVALLTHGDRRIAVAILTESQGSHAYGKRTLEGIARRLLRGL